MSLLNSEFHNSVVSVSRCPGVGYGVGDALQTLIDLRHCEGATNLGEVTRGGKYRAAVAIVPSVMEGKVTLEEFTVGPYDFSAQGLISPLFATANHARAAVSAVGEARLYLMFKTLHAKLWGEGGDSGA